MASQNQTNMSAAWNALRTFIGMGYIQRVGNFAYAQLKLRNLRYY